METQLREIQCTEVWGGIGECDVSVKLAGVRGECLSKPYAGDDKGGDIHFLSVCGMSILSKIVLADVSGHGAENAEVAQVIHEALVENIGAHDNSTMLRQVNEAFLERQSDDFKFTTMVSMIIDSRDRSLVYAYAGHPAILHGSAETGRFRPVRPERGPFGGVPLGVLAGTEYEQHMVQLAPGDVLVVYTDAFTEARDDDRELLGLDGFVRVLEEAGTMEPWKLKQHVIERLGGRTDDDASLVVLEVL